MNGRNIQSVAKVDDLEDARLEEAGLWFDQLEEGVADRNAFELWRSNPDNAVAFARVADSSNWLDNQKHRISDEYIDRQVVAAKGRRNFVLAAAGGVGVLLVGGGTISMLNPPRAEASTGVGDHNSIALPDGGTLDLNTDTKVYWRFDKKVRRVWLERGELAISVAEDPRPLILERGKLSIQVTAGQLNARTRGEDLTVVVTDGAARIIGSDQAVTSTGPIGPGTSVSLEAGKQSLATLTPEQFENVSAWRNDEIVFSGVDLSQAVAEYNRYLKRKIVLSDGSISTIKIGGRFTTRNPADFLAALQTSLGLRVTDDGKGPILVVR